MVIFMQFIRCCHLFVVDPEVVCTDVSRHQTHSRQESTSQGFKIKGTCYCVWWLFSLILKIFLIHVAGEAQSYLLAHTFFSPTILPYKGKTQYCNYTNHINVWWRDSGGNCDEQSIYSLNKKRNVWRIDVAPIFLLYYLIFSLKYIKWLFNSSMISMFLISNLYCLINFLGHKVKT